MIIAGAGGHGLEVLQLLLNQGIDPNSICFFDEDPAKSDSNLLPRPVISDWTKLEDQLAKVPDFCLGVGNPEFRERLTIRMEELGGKFCGLRGEHSFGSIDSIDTFDLMSFAFLGPVTYLGKGVLINTRANIHHECRVGDFTEIGPGAMLLGAVQVGKKCRIGAGAIILPGIKLGDEVIVGAGAVVTRDLAKGQKVKGVPAK
jgi:sugar O-acyltransferase (sialic acid O-acetyltransferase NeuD family)